MAQLKTISLAVAAALALAACGGGGGGGDNNSANGSVTLPTAKPASVDVTPSLGQIAAGTPAKLKNKAGQTVAETTVGADGKVKFDFDPTKLTDTVFVVEVGGGVRFKYYDEATGKEETFTGTLNSVGAYTGQKDFAVTPLTHLAYKRVEASLSTLTPAGAQESNKLVAKMFLGDADFDLHTPPALVSSTQKDLGSATGNAAKYASVLALFAAASEAEGVPLEQALPKTAQVFAASVGNPINLTKANAAGVLLPSELMQAASKLEGRLKDQAEKATAAVIVDDEIDSNELTTIKDKVQQESGAGLTDIQQAKLMLNDLRSNLTEVDRALQVQLQDRLSNVTLPDGIELSEGAGQTVSRLALALSMANQLPGYNSEIGFSENNPNRGFCTTLITEELSLAYLGNGNKIPSELVAGEGVVCAWQTWDTPKKVHWSKVSVSGTAYTWKGSVVDADNNAIQSFAGTGTFSKFDGEKYLRSATAQGTFPSLNGGAVNNIALSYGIAADQKSLNFSGKVSAGLNSLTIDSASLQLAQVPIMDTDTSTDSIMPTEVKLKASLDLAGIKFSGDLLIDERKADKTGPEGEDLSHAKFIGDFVVDGAKVFSGTLEGRVDQSQYNPGTVTSASNYEKRNVSFDGLLYNATRPLKLSLTAQDTGYLTQAFTLGYSYTSAAGKTLSIAGSGTRDANGVFGLTLSSPAGIRFELAQDSADGRIGVIKNSSGTEIGTITKSKVVFSDGSSVSLL